MTFQERATGRLLLRPPTLRDIDALFARRNEPEVAALQSWSLPYPRERAEAIIEAVCEMSGPTDESWWMLTIELRDSNEIIGDLALRQAWDGRSMEIGYTIGRAWWGRGLASEAVAALLEQLFADGRLTRVHAMLHPDNVASARVLEHTGFVFEGRTRLSYWVGDDNSDDLLYGLTRGDWTSWRNRPVEPPAVVELVEIDERSVERVAGLHSHWTQEQQGGGVDALLTELGVCRLLGAPESADSLYGVVADGELVGCVGVTGVGSVVGPRNRVIIDRRHQGRDIESRAIELAIGRGLPMVR